MSKMRAGELIALGDRLYGKKSQFDNLCQEIAWQFCPDLATFTSDMVLGDDYAADRMDSFPELVARELYSQFSVMMRPSGQPWFQTTTLDEKTDADEANARGLQYITGIMRENLYNPKSNFVRGSKEADRFYCLFGQAVLSLEESPDGENHLFARCFHLKNCAWLENHLDIIDHLHRKEKQNARSLMLNFSPAKLAASIKDAAEKEPGKEFPLRVIVLPTDEYDMVREYGGSNPGRKHKLPFVSIHIDVENEKVIREVGLPIFTYVVPRWFRFADSQYAFSPATMTALADARMAQMLSQIILEAGEKAVDPPLIAKQEIVIGEPNISAGGISWVDVEHDEALNEAMEAIRINADLKVGFQMRQDLRDMLTRAFYLDKIVLPETGKQMTAYEMSQRLEEHIRTMLPLFEPAHIEYNTRLLDLEFELLRNMRKFDWNRVPRELLGRDITWSFQSPVQRAQDRIMVEQFKASLEVLLMGKQAGANTQPLYIDQALRDAIRGVGGPPSWRKTMEEQEAEMAKAKQEKMLVKAMLEAQQLGQIGIQGGEAANKLGLQPSADKMLQAQAKMSGAGHGGGGGGAGPALPPPAASPPQEPEIGSLADTAPGEPIPPPPVPSRYAGNPNVAQLLAMQERFLSAVNDLTDSMRRRKKISIRRGQGGVIESAESNQED